MAAAKKLSETFLSKVSRVPWWLGVVLAALAYAICHGYTTSTVAGPGSLLILASVGQYLFPLLLLSAAAYSFFRRRKRRRLFATIARKTPAALTSLSADDFLFVVAELYRRKGFEVAQTGALPSAGAELAARKGSEKYYIRCLAKSKADMEEAGLLAEGVRADGVTGGMVVVAGEFVGDAAGFDGASRISLIDGQELHRDIRRLREEETAAAGGRRPALAAAKWSFLILFILSLWGVALLATERGRSLAFDTLVKFTETVSLVSGVDQTAAIQTTAPGDDGENGSDHFSKRLRRAIDEIFGRAGRKRAAEEDRQPVSPAYRYEIELHSGGWIYTDKVLIDDDHITYTSKGGLEISINRGEIRELKRVRKDGTGPADGSP